ncbi:cytochrome c4 [Bordetella genomosp. 1]|uniref:Cytochrome c4 n=1 Tax=Bordetella genomosp. 1 TaxID=1395607 RepID=A0A261RT40_9BORD|nr:c-type cytochrome [Bordetella genomosp. 1]MDQ8030576.1 c-type cytochrome [Bordetella sp.]OZI28209.1 cytochrome c4 [Bordetella genomosp. 1]OZI68300.1 cytochrome c4 [Bordetella genomosp. 1]
MKRVLSRMMAAGGLVLGATVMTTSFAADGASAPTKPDAAKGAQLYQGGDAARGIIACITCHGPGGNSSIPANPNLAGQPHEYLVKQLQDFRVKDGEKLPARLGAGGNPTPMSAVAQPLSPQDIQNVALYLAQQALSQPATAGHESLVERGQKIWRGGLPERSVPACASCHSPTGAGIPGQYPRLAGQFPSYLEEQLKLFRSGERATNEPMHQIADRLSDADIKAVADYAAGLR